MDETWVCPECKNDLSDEYSGYGMIQCSNCNKLVYPKSAHPVTKKNVPGGVWKKLQDKVNKNKSK